MKEAVSKSEAEDFQKSAPPVTFSQDETFDQNLLPRMAAGIDSQGTLFFAAIDGRNFHRAPGMTLEQTARWMQALGCITAMNLDGGSSKRMVVQNQVVDFLHKNQIFHSLRAYQSCTYICHTHFHENLEKY